MTDMTFGPVPSRRLGQSLGINNIPPKICSYSCIYCQVGNTVKRQIERSCFYGVEEIARKVGRKVEMLKEKGEPVDYLTFVPDGEPSLDINLGLGIDSLKSLGIKIAVITNASLLWREDVRNDLLKADWISLKVDAGSSPVWHSINRPDPSLELDLILNGAIEFAGLFGGKLTTETMLVQDVNDNVEEIKGIAALLAELKPDKSYIAIPTRPPAKEWVTAADEQTITMAYQIFGTKLRDVEYLVGYEGNAFASTGNTEEDLLSITAVHPMREDGVCELLSKGNADWDVVRRLIAEKKLKEVEYQGKKFYVRKLLGMPQCDCGIQDYVF